MKPGILFHLVNKYFQYLVDEYGFTIHPERFHGPFGYAFVDIQLGECHLDFEYEGRDRTVSILIREGTRIPRISREVAIIFAYLTREFGEYNQLHYHPFSMPDEQRLDWEMARLAEILHPFWSRIIRFVNDNEYENGEFKLFEKQYRHGYFKGALKENPDPEDAKMISHSWSLHEADKP